MNLTNLIYKFENEGMSSEEMLGMFSTLMKSRDKLDIRNYYAEVMRRLVICGFLKDNGKLTNKGRKFIALDKTTNLKSKTYNSYACELKDILTEPLWQ